MNYSELYPMIFKRKSFHIFLGKERKLTEGELDKIRGFIQGVKPLCEDIKVEMRIVPASETSSKCGGEYCILLYSEEKDNYLQNIGYIGEQLDLYLASLNIGALWLGLGNTKEKSYNGLSFVIMLAIAKMPEDKFRKDMFKAKRKPLQEIWSGDTPEFANIVRFAPSACNSQPWLVEKEGSRLSVYRNNRRGIMPAGMAAVLNRIDMGIFLCFLDICLGHSGISFERKLFADNGTDSSEKILTAVYELKNER